MKNSTRLGYGVHVQCISISLYRFQFPNMYIGRRHRYLTCFKECERNPLLSLNLIRSVEFSWLKIQGAVQNVGIGFHNEQHT